MSEDPRASRYREYVRIWEGNTPLLEAIRDREIRAAGAAAGLAWTAAARLFRRGRAAGLHAAVAGPWLT